MIGEGLAQLVGPALASALDDKGYDTLTPVQAAVLDEALAGRDLRITSQTGSGKTVAIGFAVRDLVTPAEPGPKAHPRVLVLAPTRELAKQVAAELTWLYAPMRARVASVTGGSGFLDQKRALTSGPAVVVATPGRLRDALERGSIQTDALGAVVLDEADSMLDLGFREDLEAILGMLPAERRSHLVSATFSRDVTALADRYQKDPVHVEGTRLGDANTDIEHVIHLVETHQRTDALINLLLHDDEAKSLIFTRTRADVARIADELAEAGFVVRTLSGDMDQPERDHALAAFRHGGVQALVATDVAARGIDVQNVARVIQVEPPANVETYTHRSGRTGRAGKQGTSILFVSPHHYPAITRGLSRARIAHKVEALPRPEAIEQARAEKFVAWLARPAGDEAPDAQATAIADRILKSENAQEAVARLVAKAGLHGPTRARRVREIMPPPPRDERPRYASANNGPRPQPRADAPQGHADAPQGHADAPSGAPMKAPPGSDAWVSFRVTWGRLHGADARRVLALACRRGKIKGQDVGAIRIEASFTVLDVAQEVAEGFAVEAGRPDPRDPRVRIARMDEAEPPRRAPLTAPPPPPRNAKMVHPKGAPAGDAPPRRKV